MLKNKQIIQSQAGFTLMEIVVSTAIFAVVVSAMLVLFTNTLNINRRVQATRQVSQGTRNFTEMVAREIRNGRVDYASDNANCNSSKYTFDDNQSLAIINKAGERLCFYISASDSSLMVSKGAVTEKVNPPHFYIKPSTFHFIIRPKTDPSPGSSGTNPGIQPFVTILAEFYYQGNAGENPLLIPYQTSISTDIYDIPAAN